MKRLILAIVALAFAFAISSCCDQRSCAKKSNERRKSDETCWRWDTTHEDRGSERQHRRW